MMVSRPDVLLTAWLIRESYSRKNPLVKSHRFGPSAEQYQARLAVLNKTWELRESAPLDWSPEEDYFPAACICGEIISVDGAYLQAHCPKCFGKKFSRPPWEMYDALHVLRCLTRPTNPWLPSLYYAKAIWLENLRRINQNESHSST